VGLFGPRYVDGQTLELGDLVVRLKVNPRARRISLRVDRLKGEAIAVAPAARHLPEAVAFARARQSWLMDRMSDRPAHAPVLGPGDRLLVFGEAWRLQPDGRRPRLASGTGDGRRLLVGCGEGLVDTMLVVRAIRREAARVYDERAAVHCAGLGAVKPPISLNDARTRWGSCTPAQGGRSAGIRLSWRLALAPFEVADYVVAHECAHLLEANHGPRFWAHVRRLVGDERPHRAWLRRQGAALHAILPKSES
jgi:predicted metal-dependent hydrolase